MSVQDGAELKLRRQTVSALCFFFTPSQGIVFIRKGVKPSPCSPSRQALCHMITESDRKVTSLLASRRFVALWRWYPHAMHLKRVHLWVAESGDV